MTWERFGYICRKTSVDCHDNESVSECITRVENEEPSNLYGAAIENNSWQRRILDQVSSIKDHEKAQTSIGIYSDLNLTQQFEEPMKFKRVTAYLAYVTAVFYITAGLYQVFVAPSFEKVFGTFDLLLPSKSIYNQDTWILFLVLVTISLLISLLAGMQINKLLKFSIDVEKDFFVKLFVKKKIRESYTRIIDLLQFPVLDSSHVDFSKDSLVTRHLHNINGTDMSITSEIQNLMEIEKRTLVKSCERQMQVITTVVAVIIIVSIFFFLNSAYAPIFLLGDIV